MESFKGTRIMNKLNLDVNTTIHFLVPSCLYSSYINWKILCLTWTFQTYSLGLTFDFFDRYLHSSMAWRLELRWGCPGFWSICWLWCWPILPREWYSGVWIASSVLLLVRPLVPPLWSDMWFASRHSLCGF